MTDLSARRPRIDIVIALATLAVAATVGLVRPPYLGLACPGPDLTTCGRVGVAVWLRRPARRVRATLNGVPVPMHAGGLGGKGPTYWQGFARFAPGRLGLPPRWYGTKPAKWLLLRVVVDGRRQSVRAQLRPGWG